MWQQFFPEQASTIAGRVDTIYYAVTGLALLFTIPIAFLLAYFGTRYRLRANVDRFDSVGEGRETGPTWKLETAWISVLLVLALGTFTWGARIYVDMFDMPEEAMDVYVVGKQWMWKYQHPTGQTEIDELHVPVGYPVRLTMVSEDVIHSFYIPAFRIKHDVLPAMYTRVWFEATQPGEYHIFCTEYCGTGHSDMIGRVIAMEPRQYQSWISARGLGSGTGTISEDQGRMQDAGQGTMADAGETLFANLGCSSCHLAENNGAGPSLVGLWGREERMDDGQVVVADMDYIRRSILDPHAQIVEGYAPIMPTYDGQINEEELLTLIEYIRSLGEPTSGSGESGVPLDADVTEEEGTTGPNTIEGEPGGTGDAEPLDPSQPTEGENSAAPAPESGGTGESSSQTEGESGSQPNNPNESPAENAGGSENETQEAQP